MNYYVKRHDLKAETTVIEGVYDNPEEVQEKLDELLAEEEKLPKTSCIFIAELQEDNDKTYREIIAGVIAQIAREEGYPEREISDEFIDVFKSLL